MIPLPPSTRVYLACGATDMRKGLNGLAVRVQQVPVENLHSRALFAFRGKRGDLIKLLWYDDRACACSPSVWIRAGSSGRRRRPAR